MSYSFTIDIGPVVLTDIRALAKEKGLNLDPPLDKFVPDEVKYRGVTFGLSYSLPKQQLTVEIKDKTGLAMLKSDKAIEQMVREGFNDYLAQVKGDEGDHAA